MELYKKYFTKSQRNYLIIKDLRKQKKKQYSRRHCIPISIFNGFRNKEDKFGTLNISIYLHIYLCIYLSVYVWHVLSLKVASLKTPQFPPVFQV